MTNTQNYSQQIRKLSSKITVLVCVTTFERVTRQNGSGQNGTDNMVWIEWYTDKIVLDKMAWTKW